MIPSNEFVSVRDTTARYGWVDPEESSALASVRDENRARVGLTAEEIEARILALREDLPTND